MLTREHITDVPASFIADPFMIRHAGIWYMYFEIKNAANRRGEIGLATSPDGLQWTYDKVVMTEPYHLSYPYVFESEGSFYMVLETLDANAIRLYKAKNFPYDWEHINDLAQGKFADPCLFQDQGKWWLFAASNPYGCDTLNLYSADRLEDTFVEHPQSPLIQGDKHTARPGGRVIQYQGKLYRFCQDCLPYYGTKVRAFEITTLTDVAYADREIEASPILDAAGTGWNGRGMHQLDVHQIGPEEWIACVDGHFEIQEA